VSRLLKIAVIIVNWNGGELLLAAVNSVVQQTLPADRILVVDNNSSDDSLAAVRALSCPLVEVIEMGRNVGFAAANNHAVGLLHGYDWVTLLNPDAIASPEWLESLAAGVVKYPLAKSFASRMMSLDQPWIVDGAGDCYHVSGAVWRRFHGATFDDVDALRDTLVFGACGGAVLYHRRAFLDIGGFDEEFFCYCEDIDLAFRMQLRGWECRYIHNAVVLHKGGGTTGGDSQFSDYHGHRNLLWTWLKNMPLPLLLVFAPVALLVNVLMVAQKMIEGRAGAVLRGKRDGIAGFRRQWAKRASIVQTQQCSNTHLLMMMSKSIFRR
jgi:GT2 family glycosyltransferase